MLFVPAIPESVPNPSAFLPFTADAAAAAFRPSSPAPPAPLSPGPISCAAFRTGRCGSCCRRRRCRRWEPAGGEGAFPQFTRLDSWLLHLCPAARKPEEGVAAGKGCEGTSGLKSPQNLDSSNPREHRMRSRAICSSGSCNQKSISHRTHWCS